MKRLSKCLLVASLLFISNYSYSQISAGGQFSYLKMFGGTDISCAGLGLKIDYGLQSDVVAYANFNYYFPSTEEGTFTATAASSATDPSTVEVGYTEKLAFVNFGVGIKKYFVGDYDDEDFGFYGLGELGFMSTTPKYDLDSYDESEYNLTVSEESLSNFLLTFGVGFEKGFDFGFLFADLKLNLPANQQNGEEVVVEIPASTTINVGYRFPFD